MRRRLVLGLVAAVPASGFWFAAVDVGGAWGSSRAAPSSALRTARQLARGVARARTPGAEYQAVLAVLRTMFIGVYKRNGAAVLHGGETGPRDFYLYDFEVKALADSLRRHATLGVPDIATLLAKIGVPVSTKLPDPAVLAPILQGWVRTSVAHPADPSSRIGLLVEQLGLAAGPASDLAHVKPASAVKLNALQSFLIEADLLGPALRHASAAGRHGRHGRHGRPAADRAAATAHIAAGPCPEVKYEGTPEEQTTEWVRDKADDKMLEWVTKIAGRAQEHAWEAFSHAKDLVENILLGIHGSLLAYSIKVDDGTSSTIVHGHYATHYGPAGHAPLAGQPINFGVRVVMQDDIGGGSVDCLAIGGFKIPPKGPIEGVQILWDLHAVGDLPKHGTFSPAPGTVGKLSGTAVSVTAPETGIATLTFTPRDEVIPGLGIDTHDVGVISGLAEWGSAVGNKLAGIAQFLAPKYASLPWDVGYHSQAGDLVFDSTMVDGPTPGVMGESGTLTYRVHSQIHLAATDPAANPGGAPFGPVLPASAPLTWVNVSGQLNTSGSELCSNGSMPPPVVPFTRIQTASTQDNGMLSVLQATSTPGTAAPGGLSLRIQIPTAPTESTRVVDQGCGSVDTTFTTSLWAQRFLTGHLSESEGNQPDFNPCSGTGTGYSCTFDLAGWQPGTSGVYAIRQYSQHLSATSDGCGPNSSNCFFGDTDETTTLQLRHAIK